MGHNQGEFGVMFLWPFESKLAVEHTTALEVRHIYWSTKLKFLMVNALTAFQTFLDG